MTRINFGIPVKALSNRLLFAEHREMKRITSSYVKGVKPLPANEDFFRLGKGHVRYFVNKPGYTFNRQKQIETELANRHMNFTSYLHNWSVYDNVDTIEVQPTFAEQVRMASRLCFAIDRAKHDTSLYYDKSLTKEEQKQLLRDELGTFDTIIWQNCNVQHIVDNLNNEPWFHCCIHDNCIYEFIWDVRLATKVCEVSSETLHKMQKHQCITDDSRLPIIFID
jgi:hypothetical protein